MDTTREYISLIASALSTSTNTKITAGKAWRADVKTKEMTYNEADLMTLDPNAIKGLLLHEIGHLNYTQVNEQKDGEKFNQARHDCYNAFEDMRIEKLLKEKYGMFADRAISNANEHAAENIRTRGAAIAKMPKLVQFLYHALISNESTVNDYFPASTKYEIINSMNKEVIERFAKNYDAIELITRACRSANTTEDLKKIINDRFMPIVNDYLDEYEKQPQQPPPTQFKSTGNLAQLKGDSKKTSISVPTEAEARTLLAPYINTLSSRLSDILEEEKRTRYHGNHKQGKLLSCNAYKVLTDEARIFSKRDRPDAPDYAFHLILDSSGSMRDGNGDRAYNGLLSMVLLSEVTKKLSFKLNKIIFDISPRKLRSIDAYMGEIGGCTDDVRALEGIISDIDPDRKNIIFLITDGDIATSSRQEKKRKEILDKLKRHDALLIPIGIGQDVNAVTMNEHLPNSLIVREAQNLPRVMIDALRNLIHR